VRREEQYREFALINHRQNNNLGFQTLYAENQCCGFYKEIIADILYIVRILSIYFGSIAKFIGPFLVLGESVVLY